MTKSTRKVGSAPEKSKSEKPVHDEASATATAEVTEVDEKEKKSKKPEFDFATAVDADGNGCKLDDNGRLTAVPTNWNSAYRSLGRTSFASRALQLQHKLYLFDLGTEARHERRADLMDKIDDQVKGISPEKKKLKKAQRLVKQLESLKAELLAQGIEI